MSRSSPWLIPLLGLFLVSCESPPPTSIPGEPVVPKQSTKDTNQTLQTFQSIPGTPYLVAAIVEGESRNSVSSASYEGGSTRNLVFLESGSLVSHRLFETNKFVILDSKQYPEQKSGKKEETPPVTQWFGYRVLTEDTNKNGYLDNKDRQNLGISAASGKEYSEVLKGITAWFGTTEIEPGKLLVVYEKDGKKMASLIDLKQRAVLKSETLTTLGSEVN